MATTLASLRRRLLRELDLGWVITNADLTSLAATSITSTNMLRNSLWGTTMFSDLNCVIFRPDAASAADYIRYAGDLTNSSGLLAHTGANYSDTTTPEVIEIWKYGIRPTREVIDSLNRCLEFEFRTSHHLFSHGSRVDYAMDIATTDTNWTDVGTPTTSAKTTSQSTQLVPFGPRAYQLIADAANEGTRSSPLLIGQGGTVSAFAIIAADAGTASFRLRDNTNSADIGTAVTHSERTPMLMVIHNQEVPDTCKAVQFEALGTVNPSTIYVNQTGIYVHDNLMVQLPSFITESFMAPKFMQAVPRTQIATDVYDAGSLDFVPLTEGVDYWPVFGHSDAQQYKVRFRDASLFEWPIFVEYKRPGSDETTFAEDETATTNIPIHNLLPRWKIDVLDTILLGKIPSDKWQVYRQKAQGELIKAQVARPSSSLTGEKPWFSTNPVY